MYHYNPISDYSLFPKLETQHFYEYPDIFRRKQSAYRYVYWIDSYLLVDHLKHVDRETCILNDPRKNKMLFYARNMGFLRGDYDIHVHTDNVLPLFRAGGDCTLLFSYGRDIFGIDVYTVDDGKSRRARCFLNGTLFQPSYSVLSDSNASCISVLQDEFADVLVATPTDHGFRVDIDSSLFNSLPVIMNAHDWLLVLRH